MYIGVDGTFQWGGREAVRVNEWPETHRRSPSRKRRPRSGNDSLVNEVDRVSVQKTSVYDARRITGWTR